MPETFISSSSQETQNLAKKLLNRLAKRNVVALYGELGSGKTTFVQGLAKALGVKSNVQSPTFTLVREHTIEARSKKQEARWKHLVHVDCYRIDTPKDLKGASLQEYWEDKANLVVIEWAERVKDILPKDRVEICFEQTGTNTRKITLMNNE
jgi:tRNA threonylcarbamoyladenosine biosynthesis protein TsaE